MNVINLSQAQNKNPEFLDQVIRASGENLRKCYVCGKCSAGCPVAFAMDYPPNRIARMIQLGLKDEVLNSRSIWICLTCSTCGARCPKDINMGAVHDALRIVAYKAGITKQAKDEVVFHNAFMKSILNFDRVFELGLVIDLKLGTGNLFQDAELGPGMLLRGKLPFVPHRVLGSKVIKKIAENLKRLEGEH